MKTARFIPGILLAIVGIGAQPCTPVTMYGQAATGRIRAERLPPPTPAHRGIDIRVATFNIENFSPSPGDPQFDAAVAVLQRIGADVVCVQEMIAADSFVQLAEAAGYPQHVLANTDNAIDAWRMNGIMSKHRIVSWSQHTSITLSGDQRARDLTRNFIAAEIEINGAARDLVVVSGHWASMSGDPGEFNRSVESIRMMQITDDYNSGDTPYFIAGDMNDDISDPPDTPPQFAEPPPGMPAQFSLGADIMLPIVNSVFRPLQTGSGAQKVSVIDALQLDGSDATHTFGGRIDYLWCSDAVQFVAAEVYNSENEWIPGGLPKYGDPLPRITSEIASDHLLVFADVRIPAACSADVNEDGVVNVVDLLMLLGAWGTDGPGADLAEPCDIVNVSDLLVLLGAWGECP